jgi:hypothetical protein
MEKLFAEFKDGLPVNVDIQNAIDGFANQCYDIVKYSLEDVVSGKMDFRAKSNPFVGSIDAMTALFKRLNKYPEPIDFPNSIINSGLLNRGIIQMTLNEAIKWFRNINNPIFIKPVQTKLFDGILISNEQDLNYFRGHDNPDVWVSSKIEIVSEHRAYIYNANLVYCCSYAGDFRINPSYDYIDRLIENYDGQPIAYNIDVAVLANGDNVVVEFGDFWSNGSYGLYCIDYAKMLLDRYFEIIS